MVQVYYYFDYDYVMQKSRFFHGTLEEEHVEVHIFLSEASPIVCFYLCVLLLTAATLNRKTPVPLCDTFHTHTPIEDLWGFLPSHLAHFWCWIKKDKMRERGGGGEGEREQSRLSTPVKGTLCWALLCKPPPSQPSLRIHPSSPSLPSKARADFSLNAITNVTGPIHGQMEGWRPIPSLENDRNLGCRWRSGWIDRADFRGPDRDGKNCFFQGFSLCFPNPEYVWYIPLDQCVLIFSGQTSFVCREKEKQLHICYIQWQLSVFSLCSEAPPSKTSSCPHFFFFK